MSTAPVLSLEAQLLDTLALANAAHHAGITQEQAIALLAALPVDQAERICASARARRVRDANRAARLRR